MNRVREAIVGLLGVVLVGSGLLALRLSSHPVQPTEAPHLIRGDSQAAYCGPYSLCIALGRLGIPAEMNDLVSKCKTTIQGAALGNMKKAAKEAGASARLAVLSWEELARLDGTAILYTVGPHFLAVDPREVHPDRTAQPDSLRVYDSLQTARWVSRRELEALWPDGQCLILKRRNRGRSSTNEGVEFDVTWIDVGFRRSTETAEGVYRIRNTGRVPLNLKVASKSCGCATCALERKIVPPGETCRLTVAVALQDKRGPFTEYVVVETSYPKRPIFRVFLRGSVFNERLTSTDVLYFGEMIHDSEKTRSFVVHDPGEGKLEISDVKILLDAGPERAEVRAIYRRIEQPSTFGETEVRSRFAIREGDYLVTVGARSCADSHNTGTFGGVCRVFTNLPGETQQCDVRLSGLVEPDLQANPAGVVMSYEFQPAGNTQIRLSSRSGRPIEMRSVHVEGDGRVNATYHHAKDIGEYTVAASLRDDPSEDPPTVTESRLVCQTNLGDLVIPVVVLPARTR